MSKFPYQRLAFLDLRDDAPGYIVESVRALAREFAAHGVEVSFLGPGSINSSAALGFTAVAVGRGRRARWRAAAWLASHRDEVEAVVEIRDPSSLRDRPMFVPRRIPLVTLVPEGKGIDSIPGSVRTSRRRRSSTSRDQARPLVVSSQHDRVRLRQALRLKNPIYLTPRVDPATLVRRHNASRGRAPLIVAVGAAGEQECVRQALVGHNVLVQHISDSRLVLLDHASHSTDPGHQYGLPSTPPGIEIVRFRGRASFDQLLDQAWLVIHVRGLRTTTELALHAERRGVPTIELFREGEGWGTEPRLEWGFGDAEWMLNTIRVLAAPDEASRWSKASAQRAAHRLSREAADRIGAILSTEKDRLRLPAGTADRRRRSDLTVVVEWDTSDQPLPRDRRRTDLVQVGADTTIAVLFGADERHAATATSRWGLRDVTATVARPHDLEFRPHTWFRDGTR